MAYSLWLNEENASSSVNEEMDDDALARAAQKNRAAFVPLYRRYATRVYQYIYSRVSNQADAEDLTAQVFADALAALPRYRPQGRFAGWLFTFAYRRSADFHRRPRVETLTDQLTTTDPGPDELAVQRETFQRLEQLLDQLSQEEQEMIQLHYAACLSYAEIGDVLHCSEGAIKMAMSRLIQKLRARWEVTPGGGAGSGTGGVE